MDFKNQIELELYFADHFDTILFPVLAELYFRQDDLRRARKVCEIGLKHHENDSAGLFLLAQIEKQEGNLKESEKLLERVLLVTRDHLSAAVALCEIQTVLGRATNRLLKSWKRVLDLDPKHETAQSFIKKRAKSFSDRRNFVVNYLNSIPGITCLMPKGAFYVFPSCKGLIGKKTKIKNDTDFVQKLLEKQNVAVVQGSAFGLDGYFRISYATSMQKLKVAMVRIKLFCESLG